MQSLLQLTSALATASYYRIQCTFPWTKTPYYQDECMTGISHLENQTRKEILATVYGRASLNISAHACFDNSIAHAFRLCCLDLLRSFRFFERVISGMFLPLVLARVESMGIIWLPSP